MKFIAFIPAILLIGAAPPEALAPAKILPPTSLDDVPLEILEQIAARPILPQDECKTVHQADPDETMTARAIPLTEAKGGQLYLPVLRYDENGCVDPLTAGEQRYGR